MSGLNRCFPCPINKDSYSNTHLEKHSGETMSILSRCAHVPILRPARLLTSSCTFTSQTPWASICAMVFVSFFQQQRTNHSKRLPRFRGGKPSSTTPDRLTDSWRGDDAQFSIRLFHNFVSFRRFRRRCCTPRGLEEPNHCTILHSNPPGHAHDKNSYSP